MAKKRMLVLDKEKAKTHFISGIALRDYALDEVTDELARLMIASGLWRISVEPEKRESEVKKDGE